MRPTPVRNIHSTCGTAFSHSSSAVQSGSVVGKFGKQMNAEAGGWVEVWPESLNRENVNNSHQRLFDGAGDS